MLQLKVIKVQSISSFFINPPEKTFITLYIRNGTAYILFGIKKQRMVMSQNVNDVNKERTRLAVASSVCVTRPNIMVS